MRPFVMKRFYANHLFLIEFSIVRLSHQFERFLFSIFLSSFKAIQNFLFTIYLEIFILSHS
jgi:hypothetical protein